MDNTEQLSQEQIEQNSTKATIVGFVASLLFLVGGSVGIAAFFEKQKKDHLNVVIENKNGKLLVEDVNTKEQRIVEMWYGLSHEEHKLYIFPGDTINIQQNEDVYKKNKIITMKSNANVDVNKDSIYAREQRALFNAKKQQMMNQR